MKIFCFLIVYFTFMANVQTIISQDENVLSYYAVGNSLDGTTTN